MPGFIRKQAFRLARASHTPVPYWMGLTLTTLFRWIDSANEIVEEDKKVSQGTK